MLIDLERGQVAIVDRLLEIVVRSRQLTFTVKQPERVSCDEVHRRCCQTDLVAVEVMKDVAVDIVDTAVRLIGDDQIEEARIEGLEDLLHRRVGGEEHALARIRFHARCDNADRLCQEIVEGVLRLLAQLLAVAQEQDALYPSRPDQKIGERDRHPRLASAGRLHDQCFAVPLREALGNPFDRLHLIKAINNLIVDFDRIKRLLLRALVVRQML